MHQWIGSALVQIMAVAYSAPSHYLNQCWFIVNWNLRNKLQWNFNENTKIFIHKNASESNFCEMAAILSRGRWVKSVCHHIQLRVINAIFGIISLNLWMILNAFLFSVRQLQYRPPIIFYMPDVSGTPLKNFIYQFYSTNFVCNFSALTLCMRCLRLSCSRADAPRNLSAHESSNLTKMGSDACVLAWWHTVWIPPVRYFPAASMCSYRLTTACSREKCVAAFLICHCSFREAQLVPRTFCL